MRLTLASQNQASGLETGQFARRPPGQYGGMENLIFRCAPTGLNVQIGLPDEPPGDRTDSYEAVACGRVHLINKATGKMLGDKER
jgi:hypothetical protein